MHTLKSHIHTHSHVDSVQCGLYGDGNVELYAHRHKQTYAKRCIHVEAKLCCSETLVHTFTTFFYQRSTISIIHSLVGFHSCVVLFASFIRKEEEEKKQQPTNMNIVTFLYNQYNVRHIPGVTVWRMLIIYQTVFYCAFKISTWHLVILIRRILHRTGKTMIHKKTTMAQKCWIVLWWNFFSLSFKGIVQYFGISCRELNKKINITLISSS